MTILDIPNYRQIKWPDVIKLLLSTVVSSFFIDIISFVDDSPNLSVRARRTCFGKYVI